MVSAPSLSASFMSKQNRSVLKSMRANFGWRAAQLTCHVCSCVLQVVPVWKCLRHAVRGSCRGTTRFREDFHENSHCKPPQGFLAFLFVGCSTRKLCWTTCRRILFATLTNLAAPSPPLETWPLAEMRSQSEASMPCSRATTVWCSFACSRHRCEQQEACPF